MLANRAILLIGLVAGCFNPSYSNPTCGPRGECPGSLTCVAGTCQAMQPDDASLDIDSSEIVVDAAVDMMAMPDAPPGTVTLTFRQNVNGYTGASDTYLDVGNPTLARGTEEDVRYRYNGTDNKMRYGLLQFQGLFGGSGIPSGATIVSATLQLAYSNVNSTGQLNEAAVAWTDTVTYATFGGTAGVDSSEIGTLVVATLPTAAALAMHDVKASIERWLAAPSTNHGWIFVPTAPDDTDSVVRSSDNSIMMYRPLLTISYTP